MECLNNEIMLNIFEMLDPFSSNNLILCFPFYENAYYLMIKKRRTIFFDHIYKNYKDFHKFKICLAEKLSDFIIEAIIKEVEVYILSVNYVEYAIYTIRMFPSVKFFFLKWIESSVKSHWEKSKILRMLFGYRLSHLVEDVVPILNIEPKLYLEKAIQTGNFYELTRCKKLYYPETFDTVFDHSIHICDPETFNFFLINGGTFTENVWRYVVADIDNWKESFNVLEKHNVKKDKWCVRYAARYGNLNALKLMVSKNFYINKYCMIDAMYSKNAEVIRYLKHKLKLKKKFSWKCNYALKEGYWSCMKPFNLCQSEHHKFFN